MRLNSIFNCVTLLLITATFFSCNKSKKMESTATGWKYNDAKWGGFHVPEKTNQETGPGLVMVEGGTFVMGNVYEDVTFEHHHMPRRVTVSSFYMDETEVTNLHYREYMYWLDRVFGDEYPEVVRKAMVDTLVWRSELAYNEPFVEYYFRHPSYNNYPVVGVSWKQANDFSSWRSDRVNEMLLIKKGVLDHDPAQTGIDHFNRDTYLLGDYEGVVKSGLKKQGLFKGKKDKPDLESEDIESAEETRQVTFSDGIMLPNYRLPTEAEWEYAALALTGNQIAEDESITDRRVYPWDGNSVRWGKRNKWQGKIMANFKRGRGDNMGLAGALNDNAEIPAEVKTFFPNDYGLYNMAGNVSEWTLDVYRAMTSVDADDFNPYRGNVFKTREVNEDGSAVFDSLGRAQYRLISDEENVNRRNYRKGYAIDFKDGDEESGVTYGYGKTTLISDKSRVIKGASWNDRAYYLSPGTRRYMEEDQGSAEVGFRCAMTRVGSPGGNSFGAKSPFKK